VIGDPARVRLLGLLVVGLLPACQLVFALDEPSLAIDAPHLQPEAQFIGRADLVLEDGAQIDTSLMLAPPEGVVLEVAAHADQNFDVVVLRGNTVTILGTVQVTGDRPFVILARSIIVEGVLDASGHSETPGPAGGAPGGANEDGFGGSGLSMGSSTGGGGGGGFGDLGGVGGGGVTPACMNNAPGGSAGETFGAPEILVLAGGGSGGTGAAATSCERSRGGGGGGAIQLSAIERIFVTATGVVTAGGGGGRGGLLCANAANAPAAGAGGGAGGTVYLDAPELDVVGVVSANGGGGGGSGNSNNGPGGDGADAGGRIEPASGGMEGGGGDSRVGGAGGARDAAAEKGGGGCEADGGGGGGAVGRIVQRGLPTSNGMISPAPVVIER
jgi:hypothetical protein